MPSDALGSALADADGCYLGEAIAGTGGAVHIRWSKSTQTFAALGRGKMVLNRFAAPPSGLRR